MTLHYRHFLILLFVLVGMAKSHAQISIDASTFVGPTIDTWGFDIKGGVNRMNKTSKAKVYYQDTSANLLRVSIEANAHMLDGSISTDTSLGIDWQDNYDRMLDSVRTAKAVNPNIEIFASLKLRGANTFPSWTTDAGTTGKIFNNDVELVNRQNYAQVLTNYVSFMADEGIKIDYLGPNNETDGALTVNRYDEVVENLNSNLNTLVGNGTLDPSFHQFQIVGGEGFAVDDSSAFIAGLASNGDLHTVDIAGSHFYAKTVANGNDSPGSWDTMSVSSGGKKMWFTEVHMNAYNTNKGETAGDNIRKMRGGMSTIFDANKRGVSGFSWWSGAENNNRISHLLRRELVNSTMNGTPIATSPDFDVATQNDPLFQAYLTGDLLHLWLANPGSTMSDLVIDIDNLAGQEFGLLNVRNIFWANGDIIDSDGAYSGELDWTYDELTQQFTISQLPANSVALMSFTAIPEPSGLGLVVIFGLYFFAFNRRRFKLSPTLC